MTTINTADDLLSLLRENQEFREAVRKAILTEELLALPAVFSAFASEIRGEIKEVRGEIKRVDSEIRGQRDVATSQRYVATSQRCVATSQRCVATSSVSRVSKMVIRMT